MCTCATDADGFWQLGPECRQAERDQWAELVSDLTP